MTTRISYWQRVRTFGLAGRPSNTTTVMTPWGIGGVVVHKKLVPKFMAACVEAKYGDDWVPRRIDSMNYRPIAGSFSLSLHSWALAWDFFATPPGVVPPGGVYHPTNTFPASFAKAFERQGFTWGARFSSRADYPHIEWAGGEPGPVIAPTIEEAEEMGIEAAAIESSPSGDGYWIFLSDGRVFGFGDAGYYGAMNTLGDARPSGFVVRDVAIHPTGKGYWIMGPGGAIYAFGEAKYLGRVVAATGEVQRP